MKTQIILLAALLSISTQACASSPANPPDYTKRIECTEDVARTKVAQLVEAENQPTFKEGLKAAGKKIRSEFFDLMNFQEAAGDVELTHVRSLIWQADCIMKVATENTIPNDVSANYSAQLKVIEKRTLENIDKLPAELSGDEINVSAVNQIIYHNRGPVAFTMALFE